MNNSYFEGISVTYMYMHHIEIQLNKANSTDTEVPILRFAFINLIRYVSSKFYDKSDDFDIVNFPFLMATFLVRLHMMFTFLNVFGLQECQVIWLISYARKKKTLTSKLLQEGYRYYKLRKVFF